MSVFRLNDAVSKVEPGKTGLGPKDHVDQSQEKTETSVEGREGAKEGVVKEIVLKGPMSHAFTEVLNILLDRKTNPEGVLRKENVSMALTALEAVEEEGANDVENAAKAYVYVYNGKTMVLGDVVNMVEKAITDRQAHPQSEVAVLVNHPESVVEGRDTAKAMSLATAQLRQEGVHLFFRQEAALEWAASKLLGK